MLPRLLALGTAGRAVWAGYALLPLLLVPAGIGAAAAWGRRSPAAARAALVCASLSALTMTLGLSRWPTIQWELARAWTAAPEASSERAAIAALFAGLNAWLGGFVGEFLGELGLNLFFLSCAHALWRDPTRARAWGGAGLVVGLLGTIAMFRNVVPAVAMVAEVNNLVLPVGLIGLGVAMLRSRGPADEA